MHFKMKGGIDLPPACGVLGGKINAFWTVVFQRERRERLEMLNYMPAMVYLMAGVSDEVDYNKRSSLLRNFRKSVEDVITQEEYTTRNRRKQLRDKIRKLSERKDQVDRLEAMSDENFFGRWLSGNV